MELFSEVGFSCSALFGSTLSTSLVNNFVTLQKIQHTMQLKIQFTLLAFILLFFGSCTKEAGEGGSSTLKGRIYGYDINTSGIVTDSAAVQDARVYISYGDNTTVDDDTRSSYTGEYAFRGLRKGTYTIFVYSQCNDCPFNQEVKKQVVEITEANQEVLVPDIVIFD